ncbi:hypothetical protein SPSIL_042550 [Sporomusa silvacetica DSM 10669]|uniref:Uncharacterized protein n=1 Tax=Sporomusa silvacetica DSM 10669 TaxID=1123289 RepID=A0ABZ3IQP5_9FIRM|nr:hypothetical protein [Sporomusa silvacetica]OZC20516.1 hypothetical protein SPSIL_13840 [Sporomusa silvacetica DSM 10669]
MNDLERIASLEKQLLDLGYRHYQIDEIYREAVGTTTIAGLSLEQYQIITEAMEEYIVFASKCLSRTP